MAIKILGKEYDTIVEYYYRTESSSWSEEDIRAVIGYIHLTEWPLDSLLLCGAGENFLKSYLRQSSVYAIDKKLLDAVEKAGLITITKENNAVSELQRNTK